MNYSKKHCKQIAYKIHCVRYYPATLLFPMNDKMPPYLYYNTAYHYSRQKKIYRW